MLISANLQPPKTFLRALLLSLLTVAFLGSFLTGCSSTRGIAEFTAYSQAYSSAAETGQALLDRLAVAERRVFQSSEAPLTADNVKFEVSNARYYVGTVDPPATASLRATLAVVGSYNDALVGLVNGQATDAIIAQFSLIGNSAMTAESQFAGVGGELAGITAGIVTPLTELKKLAKFALELRSREEFRNRLVADHAQVDKVLEGLVKATPDMYAVLARPMTRNVKAISGTRPLTIEERTELETLRGALASWVILLESSRAALAIAVEAVATGSGAGAAAGIVATSGELQQAASQVRRNLAALGNK